MQIEMTKIQELAEKFNHDVEEIKLELRRVQSIKCRLKKQKAKDTYNQEMLEVVAYEQVLKEVREYIVPKKLTVTTMTSQDISKLTYEETVRAIKSIQSKKCLVQYATANLEDNVEYQEAVRIEEMLKEHRSNIQPLDNAVSKATINDLLQHVQNQEQQIDKDYIIELLKNMI